MPIASATNFGDGWHPQIRGSDPLLIQKAIHANKCLSRTRLPAGKRPAGWQATVQRKCDKERFSNSIAVRKMAVGQLHVSVVHKEKENSHLAGRKVRAEARCRLKPTHVLVPQTSEQPTVYYRECPQAGW